MSHSDRRRDTRRDQLTLVEAPPATVRRQRRHPCDCDVGSRRVFAGKDLRYEPAEGVGEQRERVPLVAELRSLDGGSRHALVADKRERDVHPGRRGQGRGAPQRGPTVVADDDTASPTSAA